MNQTLKDIEIICVDDCGSDGSMDIVSSYKEKYKNIRVGRHKTNMGLSAARNTGILHASGDYVGFVDSDDYVLSNFYRELYSIAEEDDADLVQSTITLYHAISASFEDYNLNNEILNFDSRKKIINKMDVYFNSGMCWNKLYRRSLLKEYNILFPLCLYREDNPFVMRTAYFANKIIPTGKTNYIYRQRAGSIVTLGNRKLHFDLLETHKDIVSFLNSADLTESEYLMIFNRLMVRIYYEYEKLDKTKYLKALKKSFKNKWLNHYSMCKYPKQFKSRYRKTHNLVKRTRLKLILMICERLLAIIIVSIFILVKLIIFTPKLILTSLARKLKRVGNEQ